VPGLPRLLLTLAGLTAFFDLIAVAIPDVATVMITTVVVIDAP